VHLVREVLLEGLAVQGELAGAGDEPDADDGLLAAADGLGGLATHPRRGTGWRLRGGFGGFDGFGGLGGLRGLVGLRGAQ
jgi:hypothetical protein